MEEKAVLEVMKQGLKRILCKRGRLHGNQCRTHWHLPMFERRVASWKPGHFCEWNEELYNAIKTKNSDEVRRLTSRLRINYRFNPNEKPTCHKMVMIFDRISTSADQSDDCKYSHLDYPFGVELSNWFRRSACKDKNICCQGHNMDKVPTEYAATKLYEIVWTIHCVKNVEKPLEDENCKELIEKLRSLGKREEH